MLNIFYLFVKGFVVFIGYYLTRKFLVTWHDANTTKYINTYLNQLNNFYKIKNRNFFQFIVFFFNQHPIGDL